jgi:hypothetical protein
MAATRLLKACGAGESIKPGAEPNPRIAKGRNNERAKRATV